MVGVPQRVVRALTGGAGGDLVYMARARAQCPVGFDFTMTYAASGGTLAAYVICSPQYKCVVYITLCISFFFSVHFDVPGLEWASKLKRRDSLASKLQQRPSKKDLEDRNIIPGKNRINNVLYGYFTNVQQVNQML